MVAGVDDAAVVFCKILSKFSRPLVSPVARIDEIELLRSEAGAPGAAVALGTAACCTEAYWDVVACCAATGAVVVVG